MCESEKIVVINNEEFKIEDCGGGGACLFKCVDRILDYINYEEAHDHRKVRQKIVNHVIADWEESATFVRATLRTKTRQEYRLLMGAATTYGSEIEVRAASELYSINIILFRKYTDKNTNEEKIYQVTFVSQNSALQRNPFYLYFTGMSNENHLDGHYQLLHKTDSIVEYSNSENMYHTSDTPPSNTLIAIDDSSQDSNNSENVQHTSDTLTSSTLSTAKSIGKSTPLRKKQILRDITNTIDVSNEKKRKVFPQIFKEKIVHTKAYFANRDDYKNRSSEATAKCLRISVSSVKRILREYHKNGCVQEPKCHNSGRTKIVLDPFHQGVMRQKIFDMYMRKEYPTLKKLHSILETDVPDFPKVSKHVIRDSLKGMNFKYKKFNKKPILMESISIAGKRSEFLSKIKNYRELGYKIFYTDETWCGANHAKAYGWVEVASENHAFSNYDQYRSGIQEINGCRGGFVTPSGAGKRVIILHIGSEDGFLEGGLDCFVGNKSSSDYHDEMNARHYEEWFRKIIVLLPKKSIIVIDQAPYHTMLDPEFRNPTAAWLKNDIIEWLHKRNVPFPSDISSFEETVKSRLLNISKNYRFEKHYLLEKICTEVRQDEVKLLWLPVAHCEFNPIELVWAYVKNTVADRNTTFKVQDVHRLCCEIMNNIPSDLWENCVRHVLDLEVKYRGHESTLAGEMEPFIINTGDSDESDSSSNSSEYSDEE